jgi:hypothetical protein
LTIAMAFGAPAPGLEGSAGSCGGGVSQPISPPTIAADNRVRPSRLAPRTFDMWVILLEAFGAVALLVLIVWWTMFSGRKNGEREP